MTADFLPLLQSAALVSAGFIAALAALAFMARVAAMRSAGSISQETRDELAFMFDGPALVDASDGAQRLLEMTGHGESELVRLVKFLAPRFPDLHNRVQECAECEELELTSSDGRSRLHLSVGDDRMRLTLHDCSDPGYDEQLDRHSLDALEDELKMHRLLGDSTPFPVWRQNAEGRILWANAAYRALEQRVAAKDEASLLPTKIFELDIELALARHSTDRVRLDVPGDATPLWFEFQVTAIGEDTLVTGVPIDRVIKAEHSLHDFVQALTQTFAHLNVGLAIFGRGRELALFNPALSDLLDLPAEFLITRPTLFQVFDRLREQRLIPEPKNYKSWRQQMSELEAAAADGAYSETWSLVDGRTYRVTGRPHPDGAVAFLFEDISAEISLTRRFRSEMQLIKSVFDGLDEAIAVFSPSGDMVMANKSYGDMWLGGANDAPANQSFLDASRNWQKSCVPSPIWGDVRDFAVTIGERSNWNGEVRLRNGDKMDCRFDALPGGHTLVGFHMADKVVFVPDLLEGVSATA